MTTDVGLKPEGAGALPHSWRRRPLGRRCRTEALFGATQIAVVARLLRGEPFRWARGL